MISQTEKTLYRLSNLDALQQKLSYQTSTRKKLEQGSDDSVLYSRVISVDDKIRTFEGLKTQIERTKIQNNTSDSSMKEIKNIIDSMKGELIKANTSTTNDNGLAAIAASIEGSKENLYDLVNTQVEGEYVFSGSDSSIKPFEKNADGTISYMGDNKLRRIAVEEGSYRDRGLNGFDAMFYSTDSATKSDPTLNFSEDQRIVDQEGNEWKLNVAKTALEKYDYDGNLTSDTATVTNAGTPPVYTLDLTSKYSPNPIPDGTKFEAKTNIFDLVDKLVNGLKKVDVNGNPISNEESKAIISQGLDQINKAYESLNVAHAELGGKNAVFEVALDRVSSKLTQYNILSQELGAADLTEVAVKAKALELTYTALYSTISKTNQLSLVNFMN